MCLSGGSVQCVCVCVCARACVRVRARTCVRVVIKCIIITGISIAKHEKLSLREFSTSFKPYFE